jgi:hypothetical protein
MGWEKTPNDRIDLALDHFSGLTSAGLAKVCELIGLVDQRQSWMADGARSLTDWVSSKLRVRHSSAAQLVGVARRLSDLPVLTARFSSGQLSLDQVDAISRMATPETEAGLIEEAMGLSNSALDQRARRRRGITVEDERTVWERRRLNRQWNLDESELRFNGNLPAAEGRIFDEAIDRRVDDLGVNPETGMFDLYETRAADALTELAATDGGGTSHPPQLTVFADFAALTTTNEGTAALDNTALIPNETAQRLACDAVVETIIKRATRSSASGATTAGCRVGCVASSGNETAASVDTPGAGTPDGSRSITSNRGHKAGAPISTT